MVAMNTDMEIAVNKVDCSTSGNSVISTSGIKSLSIMWMALLPWIAVVLFTAGAWAALNLLGYAFLVFAVGYVIIRLTQAAPVRSEWIVLAPATGVLVLSSATAFWVRLGLPLAWAAAIWLALAALGVAWLWLDRSDWAQGCPAYGKTLVVLSVLICAIYFVPSARKDAVLRKDGSFNWIYGDTQYFHSVAASIKNSEGPPKAPGESIEELRYHFGGYAPAAAISRFDGLALGDAYARVTRGVSLWGLVLSCFGLGTILSLKANGERFGGPMSVVGLFFYGSLLSLFTDERNGSSFVSGAILYTIPAPSVPANGGPFSHLILGHSILHGLVAVTAIMSLCLLQRERGSFPSWRQCLLVALPALAVSVNSVGALYSLGIVGILLFWGRLGNARAWLLTLMMFGLFLGAWHIMGYSRSPDMAGATLNRQPGIYWWWVVVCFAAGLGFRILSFRWVSEPLRDPMSALVLATTVGLLLFNVSLFLDGNERYGTYYLDAVFSIFAFSQFRSGWWRGSERAKWAADWLRLTSKGVLFLLAYAIVMRIVDRIIHRDTWVIYERRQILSLVLFGLIVFGASILAKRNRAFMAAGSGILMAVLMIGFLAWITPWLNFGIGRMKMDVTISSGEVQGLKRFEQLAARDERFATNKHDVDSSANKSGRSYAYAALSERPVLLEGYLHHNQRDSTDFKALLHDNDLMFTTTDAGTLRNLADAWRVRWLVARPGTDIALPRPLPPWLVEQSNCGDLKIYKIN